MNPGSMAFNTGFTFNVTIHANQSFLSIDISAKDNISEVNSSVETPKENGYPLEIHKFDVINDVTVMQRSCC